MRPDSRLSRMLHVVLHMARHDRPMTSDAIAAMLGTNAVVVRRTLAGLRDAGFVSSGKGHGGGWSLACDLERVTLLDIHKAVGGAHLFAIGNAGGDPDCAVERAVKAALDEALRDAEAMLLTRFAAVTLADLAASFDAHVNADERHAHRCGGRAGAPPHRQR